MPATTIPRGLLLGGHTEVLADIHSPPRDLLDRQYAELGDDAPTDFMQEAIPREPEDLFILSATVHELDVRAWTEDAELSDAALAGREYNDPPEGVAASELSDEIDTEYLGIISREFSTCSACDGNPVSDCLRCNGGGAYDCPDCRGDGRSPCSTCRGSEEVECAICEGAETVECPDCRGDERQPCTRCSANGKLKNTTPCPDCSGGTIVNKETCDNCQGAGCSECSGLLSLGGTVDKKKSCPTCDGLGEHTQIYPCPVCKGAKSVDCDSCAGSGNQDCESCGGTGTEPCRDCVDGTEECETCDGLATVDCELCEDGTDHCDTCGGEGETHSVKLRRSKLVAETDTIETTKGTYGIESPLWIELPPFVLKYEDGAPPEEAEVLTEISFHQLTQGPTAYLVETLCFPVRKLVYDYHDQNFTIREVHNEIHYTRHP